MSPIDVSLGLWGVWLLSWIAAAVWTRRTVASAGMASEMVYRVVTVAGGLMLFWAAGLRPHSLHHAAFFAPSWSLPDWAAWLATGLVGGGFVFCWWARVSLGALWSSSVTRKESHEIVRRGPYALVRHPIYTGLILSAFAFAAEIGVIAGVVGAGVMTLGFWIKARLEEQLLSETLGAAYAEYRRTTPMLIPFRSGPAKR
jgi:protein-S-isoprenylcysteine O-methyltransferase Ste14